jgi:hypothetical protein
MLRLTPKEGFFISQLNGKFLNTEKTYKEKAPGVIRLTPLSLSISNNFCCFFEKRYTIFINRSYAFHLHFRIIPFFFNLS